MNGDHQEFVANLLTRREIAELLEVPQSTVEGWIEHRIKNRFPRPIKPSKQGSTAYYWKPDVVDWFISYAMTRHRYKEQLEKVLEWAKT